MKFSVAAVGSRLTGWLTDWLQRWVIGLTGYCHIPWELSCSCNQDDGVATHLALTYCFTAGPPRCREMARYGILSEA